jgi:hypothetical protein
MNRLQQPNWRVSEVHTACCTGTHIAGMPITLKLPYQLRFVGASALQECGQTQLLRLLETQRSERPLKRLLYADVALAQLRLNWRLAHDWQLVSPGQFEHGARLMDEVGRLLGAWLKAAKANAQRSSMQ